MYYGITKNYKTTITAAHFIELGQFAFVRRTILESKDEIVCNIPSCSFLAEESSEDTTKVYKVLLNLKIEFILK